MSEYDGRITPLLLLVLLKLSGWSAALDYCETETFKTNCNDGEVVVMTSAQYGRMKTGRCVQKDYGFIGCSASVLKHMDQLCSGRPSCSVRIPDQTLDRSNQCPRDLKTYLMAEYKCLPVERERCAACDRSKELRLHFTEGFLSSTEAYTRGCGTISCPWRIEVATGRKINLTLYDFTAATRHRTVRRDFGLGDMCHRLASVHEIAENTQTPICAGGPRERHVFVSSGSSLVIELKRREPDFGHYIIKYSAVGCADLPPRSHLKTKRNGDELQVYCLSNSKYVTLQCVKDKWQGATLDCPGVGQSVDHSVMEERLPLSLVVTVVVAIALVIGVCILVMGLVFMKRRQALYVSHVTTTVANRGAKGSPGSKTKGQKVLVKACEPPPTYDDVAGPTYQIPYSLEKQLPCPLDTRPLPAVPPRVPPHRTAPQRQSNEYEEYADYDVTGHTYHQVDDQQPCAHGVLQRMQPAPVAPPVLPSEHILQPEAHHYCTKEQSRFMEEHMAAASKVHCTVNPQADLTPFQLSLLLENSTGTTSWP